MLWGTNGSSTHCPMESNGWCQNMEDIVCYAEIVSICKEKIIIEPAS